MRTFIFMKNTKRDGKMYRTIVGMLQSNSFPSSETRDENSRFYACDCIEVTESCHIEIAQIK